MTDKELIEILRCCRKATSCLLCEACKDCGDIERVLEQAGDRLEALASENERLKAQLPKWRPASEPPEEYRNEEAAEAWNRRYPNENLETRQG